MDKIIFLDIDGVLNYAGQEQKPEDEIIHGGFFMSRRCIANLNELTNNTGAKLVISSTWRKMFDIEELKKHFKDVWGITGEIIAYTGVHHCGTRGCEIDSWIGKNVPYDQTLNYVILDDDSDMLLNQASRFINTNYEYGLTNKDIYKAQRILDGKL